MLRRYAENSTVHGIPDILRSSSMFGKGVWALLTAAAVAAALYQTLQVVLSARSSPYLTSVEHVTTEYLPFPEVQVCSYNPINKSKVDEVDPEFVQATFEAQLEEFGILRELGLGWPLAEAGDGDSEPSKEDLIKSPSSKDSESSADEPSGEGKEGREDPVDALYRQARITMQSFFRSVAYAGVRMDVDDTMDQDSYIKTGSGPCYGVHYLPMQRVGGQGLAMLIDLHSEVADPRFTAPHKGLALKIEHQLNPASDRTIFVPPATSARVQLEASNYQLLNCRDDMPREFLKFEYSSNTCRLECTQRALFKECGCVLAYPPHYILKFGTPICRKEDDSCKKSVQIALVEEPDECLKSCLPRCDSWHYRTLVSYADFPSPELLRRPNAQGLGFNWTERRHDLVYLHIVFEDLSFRRLKQTMRLSVASFLGQIGGNMGFWLGASILSLAQILFALLEKVGQLDRPKKKAQASVTRERAEASPRVPRPTSDAGQKRAKRLNRFT